MYAKRILISCPPVARFASFEPRKNKTPGNHIGATCALGLGVTPSLSEVDELTEKIIGCAIEVHKVLGPGLLESVYRDCMISELRLEKVGVESECCLSLDYKGERVSGGLRLDLLVEGIVVVELKAVDRLLPIHSAQVITYLKLSGYPAGLLLNFNSPALRAGLKRLDHPDLYRQRHGAAKKMNS